MGQVMGFRYFRAGHKEAPYVEILSVRSIFDRADAKKVDYARIAIVRRNPPFVGLVNEFVHDDQGKILTRNDRLRTRWRLGKFTWAYSRLLKGRWA